MLASYLAMVSYAYLDSYGLLCLHTLMHAYLVSWFPVPMPIDSYAYLVSLGLPIVFSVSYVT